MTAAYWNVVNVHVRFGTCLIGPRRDMPVVPVFRTYDVLEATESVFGGRRRSNACDEAGRLCACAAIMKCFGACAFSGAKQSRGVSPDESSVEIGESKEGLHFLLICRSGPLSNASDLDRVHCDGVVRDDHSEVLDRGFLKLTLVGMEVELMFLQQFQNLAGDLPVLFKGLCEDEDVVQIDHDHAFRDEVLEDVVHHRLEGGGTVREAKEHDEGFVQAAVGPEGGLPFVSFLYLDVVEAPSDVQFREVLGSAELHNQFRN